MKKLMIGILGLTCLFALAGCSKTYANGEVYVYNWGEYCDPETLEMFEEEYDIKVIYDEYETNEIMYPKVSLPFRLYDLQNDRA